MYKIANKLILHYLNNMTIYIIFGLVKYKNILNSNTGNVLIFLAKTVLKALKIKKEHVELYFNNFYYKIIKISKEKDKNNLTINFEILLNKPYYYFIERKSDKVRKCDKILFTIDYLSEFSDPQDQNYVNDILSQRINLIIDLKELGKGYSVNLFNNTYYLYPPVNIDSFYEDKYFFWTSDEKYRDFKEMTKLYFCSEFVNRIDKDIDTAIENLIINTNERMVKREFKFVNEPNVRNPYKNLYSHEYLSVSNNKIIKGILNRVHR